jgi:hypothetical protein
MVTGRPLTLLAFSGQPAAIPDGGSVYVHGDAPVNLAGQVHVFSGIYSAPLAGPIESPVQEVSPGQGPIVRATTLRCVVFGDGQFVGEDEQWVFGKRPINPSSNAVRQGA